jgi:hypothetical protein
MSCRSAGPPPACDNCRAVYRSCGSLPTASRRARTTRRAISRSPARTGSVGGATGCGLRLNRPMLASRVDDDAHRASRSLVTCCSDGQVVTAVERFAAQPPHGGSRCLRGPGSAVRRDTDAPGTHQRWHPSAATGHGQEGNRPAHGHAVQVKDQAESITADCDGGGRRICPGPLTGDAGAGTESRHRAATHPDDVGRSAGSRRVGLSQSGGDSV